MPRPRTREIVNAVLFEALARADWSGAACAAAVNAVAAESGSAVRYDASSVSHWLSGRVPRAEALPHVVEAFARRLGNPRLDAADLGWPSLAPCPAPAGPWDGDPVDVLARLGVDDMLKRRTVLSSAAYSLAALSIPLPAAPRPMAAVRRSGRAAVGASDAARIRESARHFADLDDQFGGGFARPMIGALFHHQVVPLLRAAVGPARAEVYAAASELAYLAGWMAADDRSDPAAQWYYIQAIRLADEAERPMLRATALRSLAVQALELGHARDGRDAADAAASTARGRCDERKQAWITGVQAEAAAAGGDRWAARSGLRTAEHLLERADSPAAAEWAGGYQAPGLHHQSGLALASLGELVAAEHELALSLSTRKTTEARSRALIGARLARVQLHQEAPDRAARTVSSLTADLTQVLSARVDGELALLRQDWQPYRGDPAVARADAGLARVLAGRASR